MHWLLAIGCEGFGGLGRLGDLGLGWLLLLNVLLLLRMLLDLWLHLVGLHWLLGSGWVLLIPLLLLLLLRWDGSMQLILLDVSGRYLRNDTRPEQLAHRRTRNLTLTSVGRSVALLTPLPDP